VFLEPKLHRRSPLVGERDRQLGVEVLQPELGGRLLEGDRLGRGGVRLVLDGEALEADHLLDPVVVRVEVGPVDRPVLVAAGLQVLVDEPLLVLADEHVGVDERAAAQPRGDERVDAAEGPVVIHARQAVGRVPEALAGPVGAAGERAGGVGAAALEHEHPLAGLREPVGRHRAAEARADDDRVEMIRGHPGRP
jgi:hypothetical protein